MNKQIRTKQERIIEAVRHGLEGDAAVEFIHQSGFAMTAAGIARHLRSMGGRGHVLERIKAGLSNLEILQEVFAGEDLSDSSNEPPPSQGELFVLEEPGLHGFGGLAGNIRTPLFENTKVTLRMPTDLYEAVGIAARVEGKRRNDLIVEILTSALSRMPLREFVDAEGEEEE